MKYVLDCISDTHTKHKALKFKKPEGDCVWILLHSGDFSHHGKYWEVRDFALWFTGQEHAYKVCIAGNHELLMDHAHWAKDPIGLADLASKNLSLTSPKVLTDFGVTYLNQSGIDIEGLKIWGSPYSPRFFDWGFQTDAHTAAAHWDQIPMGTDVVLAHGPPKGFGDLCPDMNDRSKMVSVGCPALLARLKKVKPYVTVSGHIHEGFGIYTDDPTGHRYYINASVLNGQYKHHGQYIRVVIEDGNVTPEVIEYLT